MAKAKKLNDDFEKVTKNVQKQYKDLFSGQNAPPAPINIRQMEELQARVAELESALKESRANRQNGTDATESFPENFESKSVTSKDSEDVEPAQDHVPELDFKSLAIDSAVHVLDDQHAPVAISQDSPKDASVKRGKRNLWQWLVEPPAMIIDAAERRQASLVSALLLVLILAISSGPFAQFYVVHNPINGLILTGMLLCFIIAYIFSRTKSYRLAVPLLLVAVASWPVLSIALGKNYSPADLLTTFIFDILIIILSGTLASFRTTVFLSVANFLGLLLLPTLIPDVSVASMVIPLSFNAVVSVLILVFTQHRNLVERDRLAEVANVNNTLQASNAALGARTHDLNLAAEVARNLSSLRDLDFLLNETINLISTNFNLYHTQIYLTDRTGRTLVLRASTGEAGAELLRRGHHLLVGSGSLNGRAVFEKNPVIVTDTVMNPNFLPNPLLPNTRSEMAIPLIAADKVLGVLDMQSERPGALSEASLPTFEALAGQLAIAIQNANLFAEAKVARSEVEAQVRRLTERSWQEFLDAIERGQKLGFAFDQQDVVPLHADDFSESALENALNVPISVANEQIGVIQLSDEINRVWTGRETAIVRAAAGQLAQHIENLRLLAQADRYRNEAEQSARRLTHEGWDVYLQSRAEQASGYRFDLNQVQPLAEKSNGVSDKVLKYPLVVRDEAVGELTVDSVAHSDEAAKIIAAVAQQLSGHIENLRLTEQNETRAHELEIVAEVSATTATLLDPDRLLQTVVDVTKERFNLYHAHIYLADDTWQTLLLAAGAGEVGRKMVEEEHAIGMDAEKSLVARAARERKAAIVNDVHSDPGFLPNPLLPQTRSEMAVPMIVGDKVIGVFDVQAERVNNFSDEDANIYTTLASQVAVALQNARLYAEQAATVTQLRELDRLKTSFLANMSHELRTPLNSILGFSDVIIEGLDGPVTEQMDNDLRLIGKNGQHLLHLINDVLDMAKIDAGRMNLQPEKFKLNGLFEEAINITSSLANVKSLSLAINEDSDRTVEIFADRTRLQQVMINLINNAIKFTERGEIALCARQKEDHVLIEVHDTGIGVPPELLQAIFQEFTQVDTSATRKTGGTGLGLPISRRLIELHGGRLWAESTGVSGEGSTFYIDLPLIAKIAEPIEKQEK
jgi:signal transduction histidine kinase